MQLRESGMRENRTFRLDERTEASLRVHLFRLYTNDDADNKTASREGSLLNSNFWRR